MSTLICPKCKYKTDGNEQFCCKCGTKLQSDSEKTHCKSCGAELNEEDVFCGKCGKQIKSNSLWGAGIGGFVGGFVVSFLIKALMYFFYRGKTVGLYN